MATFRASLDAKRAVAERLAAVISETVEDSAVAVTENGSRWRLEAYFTGATERNAIDGLFAADLRDGLIEGYALETMPEEDWVALVQRGLSPVRAGGFFIHGSHDRAAAAFEPRAIEIEAGRAFGTAHHGSTQGCLEAIGRLTRKRPLRTVLDIGTGSGVLAIAAAKAGARRVLASDIDPVAVVVARENCLKGRVADRVRCLRSAGVRHPLIAAAAPYDLITANILAEPLLALARDIRALARPGGAIVLSGLLDDQAACVMARYRTAGCALIARLSIEGWSTLILRRT